MYDSSQHAKDGLLEQHDVLVSLHHGEKSIIQDGKNACSPKSISSLGGQLSATEPMPQSGKPNVCKLDAMLQRGCFKVAI